MTYVPPEKKQKGGTSGFGDIVYVLAFYLIEGAFIFLGIPIIVLALGLVPISLYLIIAQDHSAEWVLYLVGVLIVFFQILGIQYFVRRWVLEPNKMTFRQWIRWRFSPTEIRKRRDEKRARSEKMHEWYDGMDRVQESRDKLRDEQSYDLREEWYKETGDPEMLDPNAKGEDASVEDFISLGEEAEEDSIEIEMASEEKEETDEESYSWS